MGKEKGLVYGFKIGVIVLLTLSVPFLYAAIRVYSRCRQERPDFPYPMADLTEFWKSAATAVLCIVTKPIVTAIFWPLATPFVKD
jgi:hypothetical protein